MRSADWPEDRDTGLCEGFSQQPSCDAGAHAEAGDGGYSLRIDGTTEGTYRRGTIVGGAAAGTARQFRSGDDRRDGQLRGHRRSEEHTSELQSLMRISYAVFCLKKKKKKPE